MVKLKTSKLLSMALFSMMPYKILTLRSIYHQMMLLVIGILLLQLPFHQNLWQFLPLAWDILPLPLRVTTGLLIFWSHFRMNMNTGILTIFWIIRLLPGVSIVVFWTIMPILSSMLLNSTHAVPSLPQNVWAVERDYESFCPNFCFLPADRIRKTFKHTSQNMITPPPTNLQI